MHERLRTRYVADLTRDIDLLSGANFERFGYRIIEHIQPAPWTHRGTNIPGAPVAHVVDSVAHGGRFVAQYSSEASYFEGDLRKLRDDIDQALLNHPGVAKLWMLSSREQGPTATTRVQQTIAEQSLVGRELDVLDSRAIADHIVDHLLDESFIASIEASLPFLTRIASEWAISHQIPTYSSYVSRTADESAVEGKLARERRVQVVGISGLGKSALCSAIAQRVRASYELALWIDAGSIRNLEDLADIDVFRAGEKQNVLALIRSRSCLLILDDVTADLDTERLLVGAAAETRILVTSQYDQPGAYHLSSIDPETARRIVDAGNSSPCPDDVFRRIWGAVGGHPLLLAILGGLAAADPAAWVAAAEACGDAVNLEDDRYRRVCERILERHRSSLEQEIHLLAWLGTPRIDPDLWKAICGSNSQRILDRRRFLAAGSTDVLRIHDLVFASATAVAERAAARPATFGQAVAAFLASQMLGDDLVLQRMVRLHQPLLARELRNGTQSAALRYAYALSRPPDASIDLLGDPIEQARVAARLPFGGRAVEVEIFSIVECIEALYTATKNVKGKDDAKRELGERVGAFDLLESIAQLPTGVRRDLRHHRAKALLWAGRHAEARAVFEELLNVDPDFCAGRLQLARLLLQLRPEDPQNVEDALGHIAIILGLAKAQPAAVSVQVTLATFSLLREKALKPHAVRLLREHEELLIDNIRRAVPFSHQQPFAVAAALGVDLWYQEPALFRRLVDALPAAYSFPATDRDRFDLAQILKFGAKVVLQDQPGHANRLLEEANCVYESMAVRNNFQRIQFSECLTLLDLAPAAVQELSAVPKEERDSFWHQRQAQALLRMGDPRAALAHINVALQDKLQEKYHPAFFHDRFLIRRALGESNAIADLEAAVARCGPGRYKLELEAELATARASGEQR
jgi:tetratricopeptide (TPR) repeat protein